MFYDNLLNECTRQGLKITPIVQECGGASGSIASWKKGAMPNSDIVVKLSARLNASCDYLLTGKEPITPTSLNLSEDEQELLDAYKKLDKRGHYKLHTVIYEELDRVAASQTIDSPKSAPQPASEVKVDEFGDPLVPWAASGWADITPENAEKFQKKLQKFERENREAAENELQQRLIQEQAKNKK